jgi:DNA helicase HerA-like ATPase
VYDPLWQYNDLGKVVHLLKEITDSDLQDTKHAIVYQPEDDQDTEENFDIVARYVFKAGNMVFVGEEINEYMTPYKITPQFRALMRRGRNYGIGIVAVTHRPAHLSLNFLNMIDHWFIFPQDLDRDLERLEEYLHRANEKLDGDFVASMPDRHFIHYWRDRETGRANAIPQKPVPPIKNMHTKPVEEFKW